MIYINYMTKKQRYLCVVIFISSQVFFICMLFKHIIKDKNKNYPDILEFFCQYKTILNNLLCLVSIPTLHRSFPHPIEQMLISSTPQGPRGAPSSAQGSNHACTIRRGPHLPRPRATEFPASRAAFPCWIAPYLSPIGSTLHACSTTERVIDIVETPLRTRTPKRKALPVRLKCDGIRRRVLRGTSQWTSSMAPRHVCSQLVAGPQASPRAIGWAGWRTLVGPLSETLQNHAPRRRHRQQSVQGNCLELAATRLLAHTRFVIVPSSSVAMAFGVSKGMVAPLLVINFCLYFISADIAGSLLNKAFDRGSFVLGGGLPFGVSFWCYWRMLLGFGCEATYAWFHGSRDIVWRTDGAGVVFLVGADWCNRESWRFVSEILRFFLSAS